MLSTFHSTPSNPAGDLVRICQQLPLYSIKVPPAKACEAENNAGNLVHMFSLCCQRVILFIPFRASDRKMLLLFGCFLLNTLGSVSNSNGCSFFRNFWYDRRIGTYSVHSRSILETTAVKAPNSVTFFRFFNNSLYIFSRKLWFLIRTVLISHISIPTLKYY